MLFRSEHQANKTVSVQVGRTPVSSMIKQDGNIFKLCLRFWHYRIIYAKKYRLCTKEIRNQPESHGRSDIHEPGVIRFRIGAGIIKDIERFTGNTG